MDREELRERVQYTVNSAVSYAVGWTEPGPGRGEKLAAIATEACAGIMAIVEPLLPQWTRVTLETPLPDERDGVVVALRRSWRTPTLAMIGEVHPADEAANAYAFYRLPPPPDQPKEAT